MTPPPQAFAIGARVWYRPALRGYGYHDADIPAIVMRYTPARVVVGLLTHGGDSPFMAWVTAATVEHRVRLRDERAPIDYYTASRFEA